MIARVEDMPVYRLFFALAQEVEQATRNLGPDFRWLRVQVLRSSESVCANLTEGFYAQYSTEYLQSLFRSRREGRETTTHLKYGEAVQQLSAETTASLLNRYEDAFRQLANLIASIERKMQERGKGKPGSDMLKEDEAEYGEGAEDG